MARKIVQKSKPKRVRVYRNLNRKGVVWSVKDATTGRVIELTKNICLIDVKFIVSKKGQERARKTKQRNVHAFIEGIVVDKLVNLILIPATYDPFTMDNFQALHGHPFFPMDEVKEAKLNDKGLFVGF